MENNPILKIKSAGPINEANIEIKKINIVGGVNGSGKTTVAKLLYCFLKVASEKRNHHFYKEFVDKVNEFNEFFNHLEIQTVKDDFKYDDSYENVLNEFKFSKGLFFKFKLDKEYFPKDWPYEEGYEYFFGEIDSLIDILDGKTDNPNLEILQSLMHSEFIINLFESHVDFARGNFNLKKDIPYNSQSESIDFKMGSFKFISNNLDDSQLECDEYIPDVFYIDTSSIFDLSRPNFTQEHILHLRDTLDEEPEWWKNIKNYVSEDFLENLIFDKSILEEDDDRLPNDFKKELNWMLDDPEYNLSEETKEILSKIENIIHGRYLTRDTAYCFTKEMGSEIISTAYLNNTPSGIKQIGIIQLLLSKEKLKNGSYIIIDEPEVNLHPDWQFKLAEILVLLAKELDITLYINSHSPVFIESMDAFIEFYDMENEVNYYLSEETEIYDKYNFNKINSDELYKIYDNLGNAYDLIDQLRLKKHMGE